MDARWVNDASSSDASTVMDVWLGDLANEPHGLAIVGNDAFVIDGETLVRFSDPGSGWEWNRMPIASLGPAYGLVADGDYLYWSLGITDAGNGAIQRLLVKPVVGSVETLATAPLPPIEGIAIDDGGVRWLEMMRGLMEWDGDGGSNVIFSVTPGVTGSFTTLARSGTTTWFIAGSQIVSVDDDGGSSAFDVPYARAVACDDKRTWIAQDVDGSTIIGELSDGSVTQHDKLLGCRAMIFGPTSAFVADPDKKIVRQIPFDGGARTLSTLTSAPSDLAIGKSALFYTVQPWKNGFGQLRRITNF